MDTNIHVDCIPLAVDTVDLRSGGDSESVKYGVCVIHFSVQSSSRAYRIEV